VPKLWSETIEGHRREVRDAILDTTAALAHQRGVLSVTMSQIAEDAGVGRATLYKYFSDVETILLAWHERQVAGHLEKLALLRSRPGDARGRLEAVLEAYALIRHENHGGELAALLHGGEHMSHAHHQLTALVRGLLIEASAAGDVRDDISADELVIYCLHAITAAASLSSKASLRRLVHVILAGLRPETSLPSSPDTLS